MLVRAVRLLVRTEARPEQPLVPPYRPAHTRDDERARPKWIVLVRRGADGWLVPR
ncbi:hypothetical protein HMPREF0321_0497 [Dermacoccus sp. Ellin185]|nr:hypothetical protein HMPREF0321_0497 [Dermacoccus sp. Ellin185]